MFRVSRKKDPELIRISLYLTYYIFNVIYRYLSFSIVIIIINLFDTIEYSSIIAYFLFIFNDFKS